MKTRLQRVGIVAAMAVVTLNIWTGAPLLGLWVGSRVRPGVGDLDARRVRDRGRDRRRSAWILLQLLGYLQLAYARAQRPPRRPSPDHLAEADERRAHTARGAEAPPLNGVDYVVVGVVILAVAAFEIWFFFFAGSSLRAARGRRRHAD